MVNPDLRLGCPHQMLSAVTAAARDTEPPERLPAADSTSINGPAHIDLRPLLHLRQVLRAHFHVPAGKAYVAVDLGKQRAAAGIVQVRVGRTVTPLDVDDVTARIPAEPILVAVVVVAVFVRAHCAYLAPQREGSRWFSGGGSANHANTPGIDRAHRLSRETAHAGPAGRVAVRLAHRRSRDFHRSVMACSGIHAQMHT
jgi:hypothetical protein